MSEKLPAIQFYPGDWRKDPCVQALDHEHKGVWIDLLCIMAETAERGRLVLPTGAPMPDVAIARNLGMDLAMWKQVRSNLLAMGVASEDEEGVLFNRRIVREEAKRYTKVEAGRKGGLQRARNAAAKQESSENEAKPSSSVAVAVSSSASELNPGEPGRGSDVENSVNGHQPTPPAEPPHYTTGELLAEAKRVCGLGTWDRGEESRAVSVLRTWAKRKLPPERIYAAIHGSRALVDSGKLGWDSIKPRQPYGLRALNNTPTLADQGDGKCKRLLFDVAAETYYRALDSPAPRSKRGGTKAIGELLKAAR